MILSGEWQVTAPMVVVLICEVAASMVCPNLRLLPFIIVDGISQPMLNSDRYALVVESDLKASALLPGSASIAGTSAESLPFPGLRSYRQYFTLPSLTGSAYSLAWFGVWAVAILTGLLFRDSPWPIVLQLLWLLFINTEGLGATLERTRTYDLFARVPHPELPNTYASEYEKRLSSSIMQACKFSACAFLCDGYVFGLFGNRVVGNAIGIA
mmetsp:Transcript_104416/g.300903  ORF Transcript_104416/g.300903 Transcript_104416/m.300903 type:complete len:212 (+) Transcript_104416:814-1449(+)